MAITLTNTPQVFSPSENQIIWQFSTDASTLVYFKVEIIDISSGLVLQTNQQVPTPLLPNASFIDLSRILRNLVKWQADNTTALIAQPLSIPLFAYRLRITEILYSGGTYTSGAVYDNTADKYFTWQSQLDRIGFKAYVQNNFVINSSTVARFLTDKPNYVNVNMNSSEELYFLQTGQTSLNVVVKTYNGSSLVGTSSAAVTSLTSNNLYRLHASPKRLGLIMEVDFTNVTYYTIQITDGDGAARSELRTYLLNDFEPFYQFANIWFANNLGGFDVYQFLNPQKTIAVKKTNIKKNIYGYDGSNVYDDSNNGIFNPSVENTNTVTTTSFKAISRALSDAEANWLQQLFQSRQAYLELADGTLAPITMNENSFNIMLNKYKRDQPNWIDIQFILTDNISPII